MAIMCLKCNHIVGKIDGTHLMNRCPNERCKNTDKTFFRRIADTIDKKDYNEEKKELESRRIQ